MFRRKVVPLASRFSSLLELLPLQISVTFYHLRDWALQKSNLQSMNIVRARRCTSVVYDPWYLLCWWHVDNMKSIFARVEFGGVWVRKQYLRKKIINESFLNKCVVMCWFWVFMASFDDNFLRYYQSQKFQESEYDPFVSCSVKSKCLLQLYLASVTLWVSVTTVLTYICITFVSNNVQVWNAWSCISTYTLRLHFVHIHGTSFTF
jgi:hypothetical protein